MGKHRTQYKKAMDTKISAAMHLKGYQLKEIGKELGNKVSMVFADLRRAKAEWREEYLTDIKESMLKQLKELDVLKQEMWEAWEKSKQDKDIVISGGKSGDYTKTVESDGNPAFASQIDRIIERKCKILGLDAPQKLNISGEVIGIKRKVNLPEGVKAEDFN